MHNSILNLQVSDKSEYEVNSLNNLLPEAKKKAELEIEYTEVQAEIAQINAEIINYINVLLVAFGVAVLINGVFWFFFQRVEFIIIIFVLGTVVKFLSWFYSIKRDFLYKKQMLKELEEKLKI